MTRHYAGFDIGGTKTLALVVDSTGEVVAERREPRPRGPEQTVEQLRSIVGDFEAELGRAPDAVGVGIAGAISRDGTVKISPNIPELIDFPLRSLLTAQIDAAVVVDNDATAATWAEHQLGAGRGVDDLLYAALGTGIGTGFVLGGSIYRGAHGFAGEAGHIVIDRGGDVHVSGVRGPWEMYASGNGLGALARRHAEHGTFARGIELAGAPADVRGEHVGAAVASGDPEALALLDEFASLVAIGLTNLIYVLDPARIVLGGGLVEIGEPLRDRVQHHVDATMLGRGVRPDVPVVLAQLGSRSAALGAAMLASSEVDLSS